VASSIDADRFLSASFDPKIVAILDVAVGLKPHLQVKDEMARFMGAVAPAFA
jgi:hypothetical protein